MARLPRVRVGPPACPATARIPGTDLLVRCTRSHYDPRKETWHVAVLISADVGPINIGWGDSETESSLPEGGGSAPPAFPAEAMSHPYAAAS